MREHKYRAWDTVRKIMHSAEELGEDQEALLPDGRGFANISGDNARLTEIHSHLLPLEYTGLKDKKGVETYHKDLCRDEYQNIWLIDWSREYAGFELTLAHSEIGEFPKLNACRIIDMEVIGNLFENEELIDAGKDSMAKG